MTARRSLDIKIALSVLSAFALSMAFTWSLHGYLSERDAYALIDRAFENVESEIADCVNERLVIQCMAAREKLEEGWPDDPASLLELARELRVTEVSIADAKGDIVREGNEITAKDKPFLLDVVGSYTVEIGGKSFETICVIDIETYDEGVMSEQYLDKSGRTVLWRRFNKDDWGVKNGAKPWTERLPENETVLVNGKTYVHWYDCITDHVL